MKTIHKLTLLLLAAILPAIAPAHDFEVGKFQYTITSDTTVKVSSHNYWYEHIIDIDIPSHVNYNSINYTITEIGDSAFFDEYCNLSCICITIPETVTTIGHKAFYTDS